MRDFGKVHSSFWSSKTIRGLPDDDARMLALYLLTSPHTPAAGVFRLPMAYAIEDLQWVSERLAKGFETLSEAGFAKRDPETGWIWICKWSEWNKPENPNVRKSIERAVEAVPDSVFFLDDLRTSWGLPRKGFVTVTKPPSPSPSPSLLLKEDGEFEKLPVDGGEWWSVPADLVAELGVAYPRVDLASEVAKMRIWLLTNRSNLKTVRGMPRFMNSWLARAPERAASNGHAHPAASPPRRRRELGA